MGQGRWAWGIWGGHRLSIEGGSQTHQRGLRKGGCGWESNVGETNTKLLIEKKIINSQVSKKRENQKGKKIRTCGVDAPGGQSESTTYRRYLF